MSKLFSTHPPTAERVARLEAMAAGPLGGRAQVRRSGSASPGWSLALLILDLGVLNRRSHVLSPSRRRSAGAAGWSAFALLFGLFVLWREGTQHALEYYTGYLIELSLSVDNLFVFLLIFSYFGVTAEAQPKVLKWGILGAIVMRLIMIALGALLLERFDWIVYVFGAILVVTGIRMYAQKDEERSSWRGTRWSGWPGGSFRSTRPTTGPGSSPARRNGATAGHARCCWCSSWWSGPTWCSRSTASRPSSRSPATRSWSTAPTSSPSSVSAPCSSSWPACWTSSCT